MAIDRLHTSQPKHHESTSIPCSIKAIQKHTIYTSQQCNHQRTKPGTSNHEGHTMTHLSVATQPVSNFHSAYSTPKATLTIIPVTNDCTKARQRIVADWKPIHVNTPTQSKQSNHKPHLQNRHTHAYPCVPYHRYITRHKLS